MIRAGWKIPWLLLLAPLSAGAEADPVDQAVAAEPVEAKAEEDAAPAVELPSRLRRFALVAGANSGGAERAPLRFAVTDARDVADVLVELGGVAATDVSMLENPDAATLAGTIAGFAPRMQGDDGARVEFVFYYSGHSDEEGLLLGNERVGYRDLKAQVDALPADVRIIVLDSCSSGALTRLKGGQRRAPFLIDASTKVTGHAFLTSASEDEAAQESDRIGGSFFTHYLVSGLRGAADTTADGKVTLSEAYQYAFHETLQRTEQSAAGPQHAAYDIRLVGTGDLVMTDLRQGVADLELAADLRGRIFVRRPGGALVAEVRKVDDRPTRLSVPPGPYEVRLEDGHGVWGATVALTHGDTRAVERQHFTKLALEPTVSRGAAAPQAGLNGPELRAFEIEKLRSSGETMLWGGAATAGVGACCAVASAPVMFGLISAGNPEPGCLATTGTCTVLGVLFATFGVPVAFLGWGKLGDANDIESGEAKDEEAATAPTDTFAY
jgi:uncharacterized caspase-like protein